MGDRRAEALAWMIMTDFATETRVMMAGYTSTRITTWRAFS
jgi:hypothetical protein